MGDSKLLELANGCTIDYCTLWNFDNTFEIDSTRNFKAY